MCANASDTDESGSGIEPDPRLVTVCWSGASAPRGDVLHRYDESAACPKTPDTNTSTDLTTAAVTDGNELCSLCEWPNGAETVLRGESVE